MGKQTKNTSREKILRAAIELAKEVGPGHISLDAVAARAGLSKGGLLYSFPSKALLLEAVVEEHIKEHAAAMKIQEKLLQDSKNQIAKAYFETYRISSREETIPASGLFAAITENPDFIAPVRRYNRDLLNRMQAGNGDSVNALIVFLAIQGLQSMRLFDCDIFDDSERSAALKRLEKILEQNDA